MNGQNESEHVRRSLRLNNVSKSYFNVKPLGVSNCQASYDRKSLFGHLKKSPRKSLFDTNVSENDNSVLCQELLSNRGNTGTSPVTVQVQENVNDIPEKTKMKPRRSMLGRRSKVLQSTFLTEGNFTLSKPLLSSSPKKAEDRSDNYGDLKPFSRKSVATPQLTPFDTADDHNTSAFFDKGISENAWSVFKSVKTKSVYEPPATRSSLLSGRMRSKSIVSDDAHDRNMRWLSNAFQNKMVPLSTKSSEEPIIYDSSKNSDNESISENDYLEKNHMDDGQNRNDTNPDNSSLNDTSSQSSNDSYVQNEITIMNLEKIEEEDSERSISSDSMGAEFIQNGCDSQQNLKMIADMFEELRCDKEIMDSKWDNFIEQRIIFEEKWNNYSTIFENIQKNINSKNQKPKKNGKTSQRKSKVSFNGKCKTPLLSQRKRSAVLKNKNKCYTPNSLSSAVTAQAKSLFLD